MVGAIHGVFMVKVFLSMHGAGVLEFTLEYKNVILCLIYNIQITFFLYPVVVDDSV